MGEKGPKQRLERCLGREGCSRRAIGRESGTVAVRAPFIVIANERSSARFRMDDERITENPDESRQSVKGHGVRYVLAFGLAGAVIALLIVYFAFFA